MLDQLDAIRLWLVSGFRANPTLAVLTLLLRVTGAVAPVLQVYGLKLIIDGALGHHSSSVLTGAVIISATLVLAMIIQCFEFAASQTMVDEVHTYLTHGVISTVAGIPGLEHHERPEIADRIELLRTESLPLTFSFTQQIGLISAAANAVAVLGILAAIHPVLLVLPLLGALRVWASLVSGGHQGRAREATAQYSRRADRLADVAASARHGLEVRVFGLQGDLLRMIDALLGVVQRRRGRAAAIGARYELAARLGFGLGYTASIVLVATLAGTDTGSAGDLALIVLLGARVEQTAAMVADAGRSTGQTVRAFARYAWLRRYARTAGATGSRSTPRRLDRGISLRDVSFRYPGTSVPVLRRLDVDLPAGGTVAIVGENGAGKSTLVKLLTRLYEPSEGSILVDGRPLAELDPEAWRTSTAVALQDFVRYELTAREAVGVGDLSHLEDPEAVRSAVRRGAAEQVVASLPRGLDTQLGREFTDGVDLSGGQWQRLALARAFMRPTPLLLALDEPTAALDPEAEYVLFRRYAAASAVAAARTGGITVLVSHRFATVRMADLILVLHGGRIVEQGSHHELIAKGGRYAELFELQARAYRTEW
ncbi:ABC transporter ATP-binding protein [Microlunatus parietis]|uniref:ATP-binding cassette subfamily B protein n=1 Tax=Microlunatus parietis TaxID=682979 RepID=A0A7Y9I3Q1_9ACTN|nr:ABC transporter ATP-binding protein [Microlunatus parietis]NYE69654.1 ATP-binding cassette subfamily B protein [Microlunatus parietis]